MANPFKFDLNSSTTKQFQSLVQSRLVQLKWSEQGDDLLSEYCVVLLANNKPSEQILTELSEIVGSQLDPEFVKWLVEKGELFKKGEIDWDIEFSLTSSSAESEQQDQVQEEATPSRGKSSRSRGLKNQAFEEINRDRNGSSRDERRQQGSRNQRRSRSPSSRELLPTASTSSASFKSNRDRSNSPSRYQVGRSSSSTARSSFSLKGAASRGGRDLFSQAINSTNSGGGTLAMDDPGLEESAMDSNYNEERNQEDGIKIEADDNEVPTGPRELLPPSGPSSMRHPLLRAGLAEAEKRAIRDQLNQKSATTNPNSNLFGRMGVPNPKAGVLVPNKSSNGFGAQVNGTNGNGNDSLLSRINPNFSNPNISTPFQQVSNFPSNSSQFNPNFNPYPSNGMNFQSQNDVGMDFSMSQPEPVKEVPTKPTQSALCRYGLICTSSICQYAHPSPAAISSKRGNLSAGPDNNGSAVVLSDEACKYQSQCTNKDCKFSHVSPAVAFLKEKIGSNNVNMGGNGAGMGENTPCRFKEACTNSQCPFAHFDPETGEKGPSPALKAALSGNSQPKDLMNSALGNPSKSEATACRFGTSCTRPNCYYSHPPGRVLPTQAQYQAGNNKSIRFNSNPTTSNEDSKDVSMDGDSHISERLRKFNSDEGGQVERILPGGTPIS